MYIKTLSIVLTSLCLLTSTVDSVRIVVLDEYCQEHTHISASLYGIHKETGNIICINFDRKVSINILTYINIQYFFRQETLKVFVLHISKERCYSSGIDRYLSGWLY